MKKYLSYYLLFCFCIFLFSTCKKYPEGTISLTSKEKRVIGNYEVEAFLINGADSTSQLTCTKYNFYSKEGNHHLSSPQCTGPSISGEDWNFENHKKNLLIYVIADSGAKVPFPFTDSKLPPISKLSWEIQKLSEGQMWLKVEFQGKEYYTKFKKN